MKITTATMTDEAERGSGTAVLPIGSFEQHAAHLPLTTDTLVAAAVAEAVATEYGLFLLSPVTISCSHEHADWPGTVSISATTLTAVISDVARSLEGSGIRRLVLVNGHGGNYTLANIVQEANTHPGPEGPRMALFPRPEDWDAAREAAGLLTTAHEDMHAGEIETSLLLHLHPELVRDGYQDADHLADRPHLLVHGLRPYTPTGVVGRPSLATPAKGKTLLAALTTAFQDTLTALTTPPPAPGAPGR
ncbi:creatininase family protein [Streptomyces sp. NPDC020875]|uniref:creatininase family protein n=1 Tax=Streptomyces sp. NPDC020875 TaxID=3154898 RepID=UPI0033D2782E